jgi:hypothetical protein
MPKIRLEIHISQRYQVLIITYLLTENRAIAFKLLLSIIFDTNYLKL